MSTIQPGPSPGSLPPAPSAPAPWAARDNCRTHLGLLAFLCLLYLPFAGNYGLWDPWETHYGEVARQMVERNDWISLYWPGSPQDGNTFWSKPVLTFWLMALSMKLFGLGGSGAAHAAEMTLTWRAEWALRLPFVLCGIAGVWATYQLVRRLVGGRAALLAAVVLATSTQWALITRQAMTDMAFVAPMTLGLVCAGLALLLPREEVYATLPRRQVQVLGRTISWPHDRLFYVVGGLFVLCTVPQLVVDLVQVGPFQFFLFGHSYRSHGALAMLPWVLVFFVCVFAMLRVTSRRAIYLWVTYLMGGLATLAKGPAGIAMPVLIIFIFLLITGRWNEFLGPRRARPWAWQSVVPASLRRLAEYEGGLEILRGSLIFLAVGAPWYAAMLVRHGAPFWMELIGDNYVRRAQGRHGDRGTFDYYLRQLGAGLFPWSGVVAAALVGAGRWLRERTSGARRQLVLFALSWFLVDFMIVALVNTKFHHYILPALPALAVLAGLFLEDVIAVAAGARERLVLLSVLGLPLTWLAGRDLANFPPRIGWLFNYDYVNAPGTGRPWPVVSTYGQRYEYGGQILVFSFLALAATAVLCLVQRRRGAGAAAEAGGGSGGVADAGGGPEPPPVGEAPLAAPFTGVPGALLFGLLLCAAIAIAPSGEAVATWSSSKLPADAVLPGWMRFGFLAPAVAAAIWLLGLARAAWPFAGSSSPGRAKLAAVLGLSLVALLWNTWVLDRYLVDISPHWSQKHVFATYYRLRRGPQDPVVAWYMYWRGENFYTKNQIYDHRLDAAEKTVFLGDHHAEKLQAYVNAHRGRRIFFLLERHRFETLRGLLPPESRASLQIVDESNNKVYMAMADL